MKKCLCLLLTVLMLSGMAFAEEIMDAYTVYEQGMACYQAYDDQRAFELVREAAERGYVPALYALGSFYFEGVGTEPNYAQAVTLYRQAADQGLAQAQSNLSICYYYGYGVDVDWAQAFHYALLAAQQGEKTAQYNVALFYQNGEGVEKDLEQAAVWYDKAAAQGSVEANNALGDLFARDDFENKDLNKAAEYYQQAIAQGDTAAQYSLSAIHFELGNNELALHYLLMAANQGMVEAQMQAARCYKEGVGAEKNMEEAAMWYQAAALQGNSEAQYNLGLCYYWGNGKPEDDEQALKWFTLAAEAGYSPAYIRMWEYNHIMWNENAVTDEAAAKQWLVKGAQANEVRCVLQLLETYADEMDEEEYFRYLLQGAQLGNAACQVEVGYYYLTGQAPAAEDNQQALYWFDQSAAQGDAVAQYFMGELYFYGIAVDENIETAMEYYRLSALQGDADAQYSLGFCLIQENIDAEEGVQWLQKAVEQNHAEAAYLLALCYENGIGAAPNPAQALEHYLLAAEQGDEYAAANCGLYYYEGIAGIRDEDKAFYWLDQACTDPEMDPYIVYLLGRCYEDGTGCQPDSQMAFKYYSFAAFQEQPEALNALGGFYMNGIGVDADENMALSFYLQAADQGYAPAQRNAAICFMLGSGGVAQDLQKAVAYYALAAEQGDHRAQNSLGTCYYLGQGVPQDYALAFQWYQKAALQENVNAMFNLAQCYEYGHGTDQDMEQAFAWYSLAAQLGNLQAAEKLVRIAE